MARVATEPEIERVEPLRDSELEFMLDDSELRVLRQDEGEPSVRPPPPAESPVPPVPAAPGERRDVQALEEERAQETDRISAPLASHGGSRAGFSATTTGALGSIAPTSSSLTSLPERPSAWPGRALLLAAVVVGAFLGMSAVRTWLRERGHSAAVASQSSPVRLASAGAAESRRPVVESVRPQAEQADEGGESPREADAPGGTRPQQPTRVVRAHPDLNQDVRARPEVSGSRSPARREHSAARDERSLALDSGPRRDRASRSSSPERSGHSMEEEGAAPTAPDSETSAQAQPSKADVIEAMNSILPVLRKCVDQQHGVADLTLTVRGSGRVSYAMVSGVFAGTPEGSCIARAVKAAAFPPFQGELLRLTYPVRL